MAKPKEAVVDTSEADDKAAEKLREVAEDAKAEEEVKEISVDPEEDSEDEAPEPMTRQARKNQRLHHNRQEMEEAQNRIRELEQRANAEAARAAAAEQYARMQHQQAREPAKDPHQAEIERIEREQLALSDLWNTKAQAQSLTAEEAVELRKRYLSLNDERQMALWKKAQPQAQPQVDPGRAAFMQQMRWEYPDIVDNRDQRPWQFANAMFDAEKAAGRLPDKNLIDECMQAARKRFGLVAVGSGRRAPTQNDRAKFQGAPSGGRGGPEPSRRAIKMTKANEEMAEAAFPHLARKDPALAHKAWAQSVGKKLVEKGIGVDD